MIRYILLPLFTFAAAVQARDIDVSPGGPISTLHAARDAVRKLRAEGVSEPMRVRVADGSYPFAGPLVLEPRDGDVAYEAAPGANPVFVGGKRITGWKVRENGVWTAKVDPAWRFEALWVNGQRATRARTPNEGYVQALAVPPAPLPGVKLAGEIAATMLQVAPGDVAMLRGSSADELRDTNVVVYHSWNETRHRIAGLRAEDGTLQFTGGFRAFFSLEPFHRLHFENFRGALDAPGEWFLARDGTLFYQPRGGEKPDAAEAWAPSAAQWLVIKGDPAKDESLVRGLTFRGLHFRFQAYELPAEGLGFAQAEAGLGAAIDATGARDLLFERCEFTHTMTHAMWLHHGSRNVTVRQCHFHDLGAGGIKIGEPEIGSDRTHTSHITIDNCIIHGGGRYFTSAIGVLAFHASDCTITHCDIADFFYSAISLGWTWGYRPTPCARNRVEFCHLHHLGWGVLSDMGAIYTLGPQPGTTIRNCHIHDIGAASYGGWGMYNDEGSTGIVWENNLVHHTQGAGYHQHYGRGNIVRNNIIAFGAEEHVRWSRPEEFFAFAFHRNIVLLGAGRLFMHVDKNWDTGRVFLADNVYWKPDGPIAEFAGKTWADWQFLGRDNTSVVADPLFADPARGDWTLRPESPALKLGFKPFDWRQAGVTGDEAWRKLAAREFPPMKFGGKPKAPPLRLNEGFESTAPGAKPARARGTKQPAEFLGVVDGGAASGKRCLLLKDSPEITPAWEPHFYYAPNQRDGTTRFAFSVRTEPAYVLHAEWRDDAQPYRTGPLVEFRGGGVFASGRKLADLAPGEWLRVEMIAKLGAGSDATWDLVLTRPGQPSQRFGGLKFVMPEMKELKWLGFSSHSKQTAKAWLDDIELENR